MDSTEQWRPVPSAPGYEASDLGRVRGPRGGVRKGSVGPCGFLTIQVSVNGEQRCCRIGTLVAEAWTGPRPDGLRVRRLDGDTLNDRAANLAYGTWADVRADHYARAERERAAGASDLCALGHRYEDWWQWNWGERYCHGCRRLGWQGQAEQLEPDRQRWRDERRRRAHARELQRQRDWYERNRDRYTTKPPWTSCLDCGTDVEQDQRLPGLRLRCVLCRLDEARAAVRRYRERNPHPPAPPRAGCCQDCGVALPARTGPGPLAKRCADCTRGPRPPRAIEVLERSGLVPPPAAEPLVTTGCCSPPDRRPPCARRPSARRG